MGLKPLAGKSASGKARAHGFELHFSLPHFDIGDGFGRRGVGEGVRPRRRPLFLGGAGVVGAEAFVAVRGDGWCAAPQIRMQGGVPVVTLNDQIRDLIRTEFCRHNLWR